MNRNKLLIIITSIVVAGAVVGSALLLAAKRHNTADAPIVPPHTVSRQELAAGTGKSGKPCLVAVDGMVYQIRGFTQWQDGKHLESHGQAYCGADMTKVIGESPHGRSVLDLLIKVGPLAGATS